MNDKLYDSYQKGSGSVMVPADVYAKIISSLSLHKAAMTYMAVTTQRLVNDPTRANYLSEATEVINLAFGIAGEDYTIIPKEEDK